MIVNAGINYLGYGIAGYNICKEMARQGNLTSIVPIADPDPDLYKGLEQYDWRNTQELHDPSVRIWHQHDVHWRVNADHTHIGFPFFELDTLTKIERLSMSVCDRIYVASQWAKNICIANDIGVRVDVTPLGVDRSVFNENNNVSMKPTIFFNCGKWEVRKGHDILKAVFEKAFSPEDNVELWMMCDIPFPTLQHVNNQWARMYQNTSHKIRLIPRQESHFDVYNIMRKVDCGIFPARAEGWNLEALELLSCGKHLIITDYSAHTEYANKDNSYLVDVKELEPANDGVWFHGQGNWAKLGNDQVDQMVDYMRTVHKLKQQSNLSLNRAGIETAKTFSWENTVKKILENLNNDSGRNT